jgi:general secretion pathway protein H
VSGHPKEAGFTLVEMLVVLSLIVVLMVVSLPYVKGSGESHILESAAQNLASQLRQTQAAAVEGNSETALTLNLKTSAILRSKPKLEYNLPTGIAAKIVTAQNEIATEFASIRFFADGGASGGKIILSKNKSQIELDVNWLTGGVVVGPVNVL